MSHGLLVMVSEVWCQNGDSCETKNYGSTLDQFLGNFFHNFLSKIRKFIFHSFIHLMFIFDKSILIFHHYATFLWLEIIFPTSTIKMKLKHQVTWQLRKCTCMILALPATFKQPYHGEPLVQFFSKFVWALEKQRSLLSRKMNVETQSSFFNFGCSFHSFRNQHPKSDEKVLVLFGLFPAMTERCKNVFPG